VEYDHILIKTPKSGHGQTERAIDVDGSANRAKTEFMASMNHELRTLLSEQFSEGGRELLEIAIRNNESLLRLVTELLDYEEILSGTLVIETRARDLCHLTAKIVKDLGRIYPCAGRYFRAEYAGGFPAQGL